MASTRIELRGSDPAHAGQIWEGESQLRIGRIPDFEVVLDDSSVSRRHAEIVSRAGHWTVRDLGSRNGTFVNGQRVGAAGHGLRQGDKLRIGEVVLVVGLPSLSCSDPTPVPKPTGIKTSGAYMRVKAVAHNSWEDAVQALDQVHHENPVYQKRFQALVRAGYHVSTSTSLDELLQSILADTLAVFQAQHGAMVLFDEESGQLTERAQATVDDQARRARVHSRTLVERCFTQGQSILCQDATADKFCQQTQSVSANGMSSVICVLLRSARRRLGVLHLDRGPMKRPFDADDLALADALAACVSTGIESAHLVESQREQVLHTVTALAHAVELRDHYTGGHTQRVTTYSLLLADALRLSPGDHHLLQIGTPLHDVGKIGIDDEILRKPGKLTPAEYEKMKAHTVNGAAIVEAIPTLNNLIPIIRNHHERWDGTGYPDRLSEDRISPLARVVAVADAFDAMTSDRPYRAALTPDRAFAELECKAGTHFDPACVRGFRQVREQVERLVDRDRDEIGTVSIQSIRKPALVVAAC